MGEGKVGWCYFLARVGVELLEELEALPAGKAGEVTK